MKTNGSFLGVLKLFGATVSIIAVVVFLAIIIFPEQKAKDYGCSEYSLSCELAKDRILLLPLIFDSTLVDAFGEKINLNVNLHQWYVVGKKSYVLIPTSFPVRDGGTADYPSYDNYPSIEKILLKVSGVKIDTTDISFVIPGLTKAAVIVSGPNEIIVSSVVEASLVRR